MPAREEEIKQYIEFEISDQIFGIDVLNSREIIKPQEITILPDSPEFVEGIINLREEIIPIINLEKKFNIRSNKNKVINRQVIIITINKLLIGLKVNEVNGIIRINNKKIKDIPGITQKLNKNYIKGVASLDKGLLIILDINNIFSKEEIKQLKKVNENI